MSKKIKLSSLSDGLRNEVKKRLKGNIPMPSIVKESLMKEMGRKSEYTVDKFLADLADGEFADGGYPTYFITSDGEALSYEAAEENKDLIIDAIQSHDDSGWRVVGRDANWEDPQLYCAHTNKRIPSAYAEPEEDDSYDGATEWDENGRKVNENKRVVKLSSLSEALQKKVKPFLNEGKTKLSQMPKSIANSILKEGEGDPSIAYLKAPLTMNWGWGSGKTITFPRGARCLRADNLPEDEHGRSSYWIEKCPDPNNEELCSWMETYGFKVSADEVQPFRF